MFVYFSVYRYVSIVYYDLNLNLIGGKHLILCDLLPKSQMGLS